eukprot:CAMPEP_0172088514 /NCGR_PEP_ID=MMETSP1043-20130122/23275_1 /TAXON_ID=464988 /ORGANISM="Hemiselmis andersenii, Strain CCMP441" /LENGTH=56 /DNA_ID=CAMNT_0012750825 /DNA_START=1 /DNA_END=171 /DNA_ORIENTATION=+
MCPCCLAGRVFGRAPQSHRACALTRAPPRLGWGQAAKLLSLTEEEFTRALELGETL